MVRSMRTTAASRLSVGFHSIIRASSPSRHTLCQIAGRSSSCAFRKTRCSVSILSLNIAYSPRNAFIFSSSA